MIVYSYGFKPRFEDRRSIADELYKANQYRNKLTELYIAKVTTYRQIRAAAFPELAEFGERMLVISMRLDQVREEHSAVPKRERRSHPLSERARNLKEQRRELATKLKAARDAADAVISAPNAELRRRKELLVQAAGDSPHARRMAHEQVLADMLSEPEWPDVWKRVAKNDAEYAAACKRARAECGLSVGTYLAIEDADQRSQKTSQMDPRFRRFDGSGKLGHQSPKGFLSEAMIQVTPIDDERSHRKNWHWARFNIGKVSAPIWVEGRITLHRPMPADAPVKWVYLVAKRIGLRTEYEIQFTIKHTKSEPEGEGLCAVNVGWRRFPDGRVRVGYYVDDSGTEFEMLLPSQISEREQYASSILSAADIHHNEAIRALCAHRKTDPLPEWLLEETQHAHVWRSHRKLASIAHRWTNEHREEIEPLWKQWKSERKSAGADLFDGFEAIKSWLDAVAPQPTMHPLAVYLEWWRRKDAHLIQGAMSMRRRMALRRRECYRIAAKELGSKYRNVVVGPLQIASLIKKPDIEDDTRTPQMEKASGLRQVSAPGELAAELRKLQCAIKGKTTDITVEHYGCGGKTTQDPCLSVMLTCPKCQQVYDQDRNAALHLLGRYRERSGGDQNTGTARSTKTATECDPPALGEAAE